MYFADDRNFAFIERQTRMVLEELQTGKIPAVMFGRTKPAIANDVAQLADYYLMVVAGRETRIEAVTVKENGDFFAAVFTFGVHDEHKIATGSLFTANGEAFCETLATVQEHFHDHARSQSLAQAA